MLIELQELPSEQIFETLVTKDSMVTAMLRKSKHGRLFDDD
jgi:hypothetical protein